MKKEVKLIIKPKHMKNYAHFIKQGIDPFVAQLLYERNITKIKDANKYLKGDINDLYDPANIKGIEKVYELISEAISQYKRITIFGDYDGDGVTSTAIMMLSLIEMGAIVDFRLPDRLTEGYGMSIKAVEELHKKGTDMIITVDNGIKCFDEIALAKKYGMKVIVLDHHIPSDKVPDADVIVDLHIKGETYPYTDLSGCGLAFKVTCYLYEQFGFDDEGLKNIDLAAIGTITDVVPLTDENRIIVKEGLSLINDPDYNRVGIIELMNCFGVELGTLTSMDIGFKIGPALNAPGRLLQKGADISLSLLLSEDSDDAVDIAINLFDINNNRKQISKDSVEKAEEYIEANKLYDDKIMILFIKDIPEGVVGLVSGKITERYNKPSLVFTEGSQYFKASGRSIEVFDLYKGLCTCDDLFVKYGGHKQAAGMTIEKDMNILSELRRRLNEYADTVLTADDMIKKIYIDEVLDQDEITFKLLDRIKVMEPFGEANPKPIFYVKKYMTKKKQLMASKTRPKSEWTHFMYMGVDKNHLKIFGMHSDAIGFDMAEKYEEVGQPKHLDVIFTLTINTFMGHRRLQLEILDFNSAVENQRSSTELMNEMSDAIAQLNSFQKSS